jgi:glycosyltransferase involved in cell wall biosynthesis
VPDRQGGLTSPAPPQTRRGVGHVQATPPLILGEVPAGRRGNEKSKFGNCWISFIKQAIIFIIIVHSVCFVKKVLIITYYWPPSGGSPVLRWLKFSKYLRNFGWEPLIYTPSNPEPQEKDESLLSEITPGIKIIKSVITEPYSVYKLLTGRNKDERIGTSLLSEKKKSSVLNKLSLWIRSNFFIPDPRVLWIRPSVRLLSSYLLRNPVDAVITTGPPHSMHLIGFGLKKKAGIKWIADFRDPWTNIDFYQELLLTKYADKKHRFLEKKVLTGADAVIAVSPSMSRDFIKTGVKNAVTITNGFEPVETSVSFTNLKFSITHLGSIPYSRNPESLWIVLSEFASLNKEFSDRLQINLIGKADYKVIESIKKSGLGKYLVYQSYIPHKQAVGFLKNSAMLLLLINKSVNAKGILTNKLFEYMSVKRPVLAIGPEDGDAAEIINDTHSGAIFNANEKERLKKHLIESFNLFLNNNLEIKSEGLEKYSIKSLTSKLVQLLNEITS